MKAKVSIPEVGESITEGILTGWLKSDGEQVLAGEELFELETDKISMSVPAEVGGVLSILVREGSRVKIGQVVAEIETSATHTPAQDVVPIGAEAGDFPTATQKPKQDPGEGPPISPPSGIEQAKAKLETGRREMVLSPAVRRLVQQHKLDPKQIQGTGKAGRITKQDVVVSLEQRDQTSIAASGDQSKDISPVQALTTEIREKLPERLQQQVSRTAQARETRVRMSPLRHRITERLVQVQQNAAILSTFNEVDMSEVMAFRAKHKDKFEKKFDVRLGFMSFFVKAAVDALKTVPKLNARIEGEDIVYQHFYDIGVAVGTEAGLVVPIIRDADLLSFAEVERKIADFATRARNRKLKLEELTGGSFTISNGGVYGSLLSTPILNPPQSGILGMHRIQKRPMVVEDQIVIRPMMYLALSYDHRIVDGAEAVTFLKRIVECVEDPERMLLEV